MGSTFAALAAAITTFAATNIDDLVILTLFFARRVLPRKIVAGQYLGFSAIVLVSLLAAWAVFAIPHRWIRFVGIFPLALGLKEMFRNRTESVNARVQKNYSVVSIALITLSNGADNVGVYVPFFAVARIYIWLILATYAVLIAAWCFVGHLLGNHPPILRLVDRWGHRITPLVFIGLGAYILVFK